MYQYSYFPSSSDQPIQTLLLDANVTSHMDSIARRGLDFDPPDVHQRIDDLLERLAADALVMPGMGAAEGVTRRTGFGDVDNYSRRSKNAEAMFADGQQALRSWLRGEEFRIPPTATNQGSDERITSLLEILTDHQVKPSYALLLHIYELYREGGSPESSFRRLNTLAEELFARGSVEMIVGALLLAGTSEAKNMVLDIMKLREERPPEEVYSALWNASFDLCYSRVAVLPSLPELKGWVDFPCVFVTEDRHLGNFLELVSPLGGVSLPRGGGVTVNGASFGDRLNAANFEMVKRLVDDSTRRIFCDTTNLEEVSAIRKYRAIKYIQQLERKVASYC